MEKIEKGYKQTEIGVIPEDWEVKFIREITNLQRGASPRPINSPVWFDQKSDVGWLRISDVSKSRKYLIETVQNLSEAGISSSRFVKINSLVMSICATVGKPIITKKNLCIHDGFVVFNNLKADKNYIYYVLSNIESDWFKFGQTGSQMNLNTQIINITKIFLPKLIEQKAISATLSDIDDLIESLEKLINKKRSIKIAMMQKLLAGKERLSFSSGKWKKIRLGEYISLQNGYAFKSSCFVKDGVQIVRISNINNGRVCLDDSVFYPSSVEIQSQFIVKNGDILIAMSGATTGKVGLYRGEKCLFQNQRVGRFIVKNSLRCSKDYLFQLVNSEFFILKLVSLLEQGAQPNVSSEQIENLEFDFPEEISEQKAIAEILSDMDKEIEALEAQLQKTKAIKAGMMQELLTGKTRLLKPT